MISKMTLPDYPIQSKDGDKLKRAPLTQKRFELRSVIATKSNKNLLLKLLNIKRKKLSNP